MRSNYTPKVSGEQILITNPLLEIKCQTQKQLYEEAKYDLAQYMEKSHQIVWEIEAAYGVKFQYSRPQVERLDLLVSHNPEV